MISFLLLALVASSEVARLTALVVESGQVVELGTPPSERIAPPFPIAPGAPPLVSFRQFDGQTHHRFNNLDLVLDDAGH
ncbi:MAG TPA: hypothetical protein VJN43_19760 [Bryobacteraceae bacterium]|nr:hypothetical protein [Bryobacteraceae bacterium]